MVEGRLFYVVGATGAGKDGLLDHARARMAGRQAVVFAHRYTTRCAGAGGDNQVALTDAEFLLRKRHGLFVMDWESGSLRYGIGAEINYWLAMGLSVVVNGSRGYLAHALKRYPGLTVIWVSARTDRAEAGLARRGREPVPETAARTERRALVPEPAECRVVHISHGGLLETAGEEFLAALQRNSQSPAGGGAR
jgi:ribose 1,5-bisphosphokinase